MNTFDAIVTKLDVREYDPSKKVPPDVKLRVLEAARMTGSGMNSQHWRFILVQDRKALAQLASDSTTGKWVANCAFAVIVLTDPRAGYRQIDAGRAVQDMQLAAWDQGVASRLFTGMNVPSIRRDFGVPADLEPTIVVGFGYPAKKITGKKKKRNPLEELSYIDKYGDRFDRSKIN